MTSSHTPRLPIQAPEGIKSPVAVATIESIALSGLQVINGYSLNVNDRVLVKDQLDAKDNGIYTVQSGSWTRSKDWKTGSQVANGVIILDNNTGFLWRVVFAGVFKIGFTEVDFTLVVSDGDGGSDYVQEIVPEGNIRQGAKWYKPSIATSFIWYQDGDSGQWIQESVSSREPLSFFGYLTSLIMESNETTTVLVKSEIETVSIGNMTAASVTIDYNTLDTTVDSYIALISTTSFDIGNSGVLRVDVGASTGLTGIVESDVLELRVTRPLLNSKLELFKNGVKVKYNDSVLTSSGRLIAQGLTSNHS